MFNRVIFLYFFQAIEGSKMYTYYYLLYKLQIFQNGNLGNKKYQPQIADDAVSISHMWWRFGIKRGRNYGAGVQIFVCQKD